jgi:hypothetical protein
MHFKRRRPKNRRSGCLLCKPHKMNGAKGDMKATKVRGFKTLIRLDQVDISARGL